MAGHMGGNISASLGNAALGSGNVGQNQLISGLIAPYAQGTILSGLIAWGTVSGCVPINITSGSLTGNAQVAGSGLTAIGVNISNALSGSLLSILTNGLINYTVSGMPLSLSGAFGGAKLYVTMGTAGQLTWASGATPHGVLSTVFSGDIICQPMGMAISSGNFLINTGCQAIYLSGLLP